MIAMGVKLPSTSTDVDAMEEEEEIDWRSADDLVHLSNQKRRMASMFGSDNELGESDDNEDGIEDEGDSDYHAASPPKSKQKGIARVQIGKIRVSSVSPSSGKKKDGVIWIEGPKRRKRRKLGLDHLDRENATS
jgi:hypothetical protein